MSEKKYIPSKEAQAENQNLLPLGVELFARYNTQDPVIALDRFRKEFFAPSDPVQIQEKAIAPGVFGSVTEGTRRINEAPLYYGLTSSSPLGMKQAEAGILAHEMQHIADVDQVSRSLHLPYDEASQVLNATAEKSHTQVGNQPAGYWGNLLKAYKEKTIPLPTETVLERKSRQTSQ